MKETDFIEKNKRKWHEFEKLSDNKNEDPDKLSQLFVELTEDLSYARTFYPKRSVRVYLNSLSQKVFLSFNRRKTTKKDIKIPYTKPMQILAGILILLGIGFGYFVSSFYQVGSGRWIVRIVATLFGSLFGSIIYVDRLRDFFFYKVPIEVYRGRKQLLVALLFFGGAVLIGSVSSSIDPEFSRVILGDRYVNMTIDNINEGDPMAVYKQQDEGSMFLDITVNNIKVAFMAFVLGIFFSVGSVFILLTNGIMVGAFQHFFYTKGLFLTSFLTIWIHGTFEIAVIIIAGGAGIVMGNGFLFPKTLTRVQSFQISAKRGINILLGTVPFFIMAGFLEGYVTRQTQMPTWAKWLIILGSLSILIAYFVVYPWYLNRKLKKSGVVEEKPVHVEEKPLEKHRIRDLGGLFYDTFRFYKLAIGRIGQVILAIIIPIILVYLGVLFAQSQFANYELTEGQIAFLSLGAGDYFSWFSFTSNVLILSLNVATVIHCVKHLKRTYSKNYLTIWIKEIWPLLLKTIPLIAIAYAIVLFAPAWVPWIGIFLAPFAILTFYPAIAGEVPFFKGLSRGISYGGKDWGSTFFGFIVMVLLCWFFSWVYHNPIIVFSEIDLKSFMLNDLIKWHTITVFDNFLAIYNFISAFIDLVILQFLLPMLFISFSFRFLSVEDKESALGLRKRFESFATGNKHFEKH